MNVDESIEWIRTRANHHRFLGQVWLNSYVTTMVYYDMPSIRDRFSPAIGDLTEIMDRGRENGWIK